MSFVFVKGTVFLDSRATSQQGVKPKYFLGLNDANNEDDKIVAFVFNTEKFPEKLIIGCNKDKEKYFFINKQFSFQTAPTSLMLNRAYYFYLEELMTKRFNIGETIGDILARQIKNCIKVDNLEKIGYDLIRNSFDIKNK